MRVSSTLSIAAMLAAGVLLQGCSNEEAPVPSIEDRASVVDPAPAPVETPAVAENVINIAPGPDVQEELQEALIDAEPGDVIQLAEGEYKMTLGLSLDVDNVTIRGSGMKKTILDFSRQVVGAEGLHVKGDGVVMEDFAIRDTKGNAIKSNGADQIVYRRLSTGWSGGPKPTNGAYGIYPVSSKNVLVEGCYAYGASDAGIYVGQSQEVIVRRCIVKYNVAGIEIENCHRADVYECEATKNTGGLLAFDLPDIPQQKGHDIRFYNNKSYDNSTPNFAPEGNIVGNVPMGAGLMIMANSNVEVFDNEFYDNATTNILISSYQSSKKQINDPNYYPYAELVNIHDNKFGRCGYRPDGPDKKVLTMVVGTPLPDIIWDGVVNPEKAGTGKGKNDARIYVENNTKMGGGEVTMVGLSGLVLSKTPANVELVRDSKYFAGSAPAIAPVKLSGIK
jgi:parallel beta-helix repeat protein